VERYLDKEIWPLERTAMREGEQAWRAELYPKVKRGYPEVNQHWVADHRKLDTFVLANGEAKRPWITAIVDWGSAAWISWRISLRPSADTVAHALRAALLQVGTPEAFYRDNGKEFVAKRLGGEPERLRDAGKRDFQEQDRWPAMMPTDVLKASIWDTLGIRLVTSLPYHAWSKHIEPMFNSYATRFENLIPGWCGRNAQNKPANLSELKEREQLLTMEQFGEVFARAIRQLNTERPVGERDRPPLAYYQGYEPDIPDPQSLSVCLQDVREEKVDTDGITIQHRKVKHRFYSPRLMRYVGMRLTVAWDPGKPDYLYIYPPNDRVMAVPPAQDADPMSYGEPNKAAQRGGRVQRRHLKEIEGQIRGAASVEMKDALGGFRMVEARKEKEKKQAELRRERDEQLLNAGEGEDDGGDSEKDRDSEDEGYTYSRYHKIRKQFGA
jgi:transposase InsO family protein